MSNDDYKELIIKMVYQINDEKCLKGVFLILHRVFVGGDVMIKLRISYQEPQELHTVLKLLHPVIKSYKVAKKQEGQYKRAYVVLNEVEAKP